jgi:hypothetical protein
MREERSYMGLVLIRFTHHAYEKRLNVAFGIQVRAIFEGLLSGLRKKLSTIKALANPELCDPC